MSLVCIVPARGGSKGIPDKNLRTVGGISLVGRAVRAGRGFLRRSGLTGARLVVDTDSEAIAAEARAWGAEVPWLRPAELARDTTSTVESTLALLDRLEAAAPIDVVVLLQPTSPLRTGADILACWQVFAPEDRPSVISIADNPHPMELSLHLGPSGTLEWVGPGAAPKRRQDYAPSYRPSGAVYVTTVELLRSAGAFIVPGVTRGVVLPAERAVDVDHPHDLIVAEALAAARPVTPVALGSGAIGPGHPCLVIAEAGVNHNGDPALAHRLVDLAAEAGADAVKFQTFDPDLVVAAGARKADYQVANTGAGESQRDMLRRLVLPRAEFKALAGHAADRGLLFLSTPFDEGSADFLDDMGLAAFKVPSGEITNHPFLAHLAAKGRPLLVSTGMSTLVEVGGALDTIAAHGDPAVALLHCVSNYPAAPADCNLRSMDTMRRAFQVPVGWSDHTLGVAVSLAAVAADAEVLEKHFTVDRSLPGPDHAASLEPGELRELVESIRVIEVSRGTGCKVPAPSEAANAQLVRRSLHATRELAPGHVLTAEDLVALRPGTGVTPGARDRLIGRAVRRRIGAGEMVSEDQLA
jgi:N,N'-diacetyllegionaminate synthase